MVGWMAAAPWSRRTVARQKLGSRLFHTVVTMCGVVLYFRSGGRPGAAALSWTGVALVVAGLAFSVWARVHLGRLWSGTVTLKADHAIVRSGPYAITRHPIYTGMLLALFGTSLAMDTVAAAAGFLLVAAGFIIKSGQEERLLRGHFGEAYEEYRRSTRRLIPFVW
jgi:protein-S-isoprenylcysteine O-methyltransferase Ste14